MVKINAYTVHIINDKWKKRKRYIYSPIRGLRVKSLSIDGRYSIFLVLKYPFQISTVQLKLLLLGALIL